jgi:hypothetical protein
MKTRDEAIPPGHAVLRRKGPAEGYALAMTQSRWLRTHAAGLGTRNRADRATTLQSTSVTLIRSAATLLREATSQPLGDPSLGDEAHREPSAIQEARRNGRAIAAGTGHP